MPSQNKLFFFDTETSGLDAKRHGILQIAWIIEVGGIVMVEEVRTLKLPHDVDMCLAALEVNHYDLEMIKVGMEPVLALEQLRTSIKSFVGGGPALVPVGHNVKFDVEMLYETAKRHNASWLHFGNNDYLSIRKPLCTVAMCHFLDYMGELSLPNYKLTTCCEHFGIPLVGAHDALNDIRATRSLFHILVREYSRVFEIVH